jgi:hypothetical protein
MRRLRLRRWGIVASVIASLLAAVLVARAWAAAGVNLVYLGLSKNVEQGSGRNVLTAAYSCDVPPGSGAFKDMLNITTKLVLPFTPNVSSTGAGCDELGTAGTIATTWTVVLRWGPPDGGIIEFGTHSGAFTWTETTGDVIKGTMAGTVGCGTHRAPLPNCEPCRDHLHFEGRLNGTFVSGPTFTKYEALGLPAPTISATYAGFFTEPFPVPPVGSVTATAVHMTIDGVYSFPCGLNGT